MGCSYCNKPFTEELWCNECESTFIRMTEGWTSGNQNIDKFIKNTMCNARGKDVFLEWVPFDMFTDIKQIGQGGFAKVFSATWLDDGNNGGNSEPIKVALKRLNGSQNMSEQYL